MENTKYELVQDDTVKAPTGATLFRIRALKHKVTLQALCAATGRPFADGEQGEQQA